MTPCWYITLFHEITLRPTQSEVVARRFRSQKVAGLLAFLAYHQGRVYSREYLCDLLWPDEEPLTARNRLRVTLASLRRQLEPPGISFGSVLETVGNASVRLRAETVVTDVVLFEEAVKKGDYAGAAALYQNGALLPTIYDDWVIGERERFESLFRTLPAHTIKPSAVRIQTPEKPVSSASPGVSLPLYLTRFIGRDDEIGYLSALFTDPTVRLITLTGSGGSGKTRLAVEAAKQAPAVRAFVPLADLWDPERLGEVLRQSLDLSSLPGYSPLQQVADHLNQDTPCRLILDNVEQIAPGAALVISELLDRVPTLSFLVTSRRRLDLPGEREVFVAPLPLPVGDEPEQITAAAGTRLFLDRAQGVRADFQVTPRNASDIGALCRLLEGVPLALELAAARVGTLTPAQIHASLQESRTSLSATARDRDKNRRHHSLGAVIEWSYALLPPDLRRFFLALSGFRGGWETDAAKAVTGEAQALDLLSRLRGHSLITMQGSRFYLLETIRSWAEVKLNPSEREAFANAHTAYFIAFGEKAVSCIGGPEEKAWLEKLKAEEANIRTALQHALQKQDRESALRLALIQDALGRSTGYLQDALTALQSALDLSPQTDNAELHAQAFLACGILEHYRGNFNASHSYLQDALPRAREAGNSHILARILRGLADNALLEKHYAEAVPLYEEALRLQETLNDARGAAQTLNSLSLLCRERGDFREALRTLHFSAEYFRSSGDRRMFSYSLSNLAELERDQGNLDAAERLYQESLTIAREQSDDWQRLEVLAELAELARLQDRKESERHCLAEALPLALRLKHHATLLSLLQSSAALALAEGDLPRAATLLAAAEPLRQQTAITREAAETEKEGCQALVEAVRVGLGARRFRSFWQKGTCLSLTEAVATAGTLQAPAGSSTPG